MIMSVAILMQQESHHKLWFTCCIRIVTQLWLQFLISHQKYETEQNKEITKPGFTMYLKSLVIVWC